jgi:hypothetical protein
MMVPMGNYRFQGIASKQTRPSPEAQGQSILQYLAGGEPFRKIHKEQMKQVF